MKKSATIFSDFLNALGVPHTSEASDNAFKHMPFQSMFGFSRLLESYNIPNAGISVPDKSMITTIPTPFLAQLGDKFVIVDDIKGDEDKSQDVRFILYGNTLTLPLSDFINKWTGIALLAWPDKNSEEPDYRKHHIFEIADTAKAWILGLSVAFLFVFGFIKAGLWQHPATIALTVLDLCGIYITWQLLLKSLKVNVKTADRICGILQAHGCDTVLEQKASKFFGLFGWAEVGVAYFAISLLVMLIFPTSLNYLALANACCLPFTIWSISYQKFKLHTWCTLCVITQCLLWLLFGAYLWAGAWHSIFPLNIDFFLICAAYAAALFGINRITTFINSRVAH